MDKIITIKKLFSIATFWLLILVLGFSSCRKVEKLSWESDLLLPILTTTLDPWDIFGDTNIVDNPDQTLKIVLEEKIEMLDPDQVIEVNDTLKVDVFTIPLYLEYAPGDQLASSQSSVAMDLDDMELTYAIARVATMKFYVTNTIQQPLRVKYTLLSSEKDGKPFEVFEDVPAATANGPSYSVKTIELDGYGMDMTGVDGNSFNTIVSETTVWLHPDADTIWITPLDTLLIVSTFEELKIEYAHGYFGKKQYSGSGSTSVQVFGNFKSGSFDLENTSAKLKLSNYTGMDVQMSLDKLSTYNNTTQVEKELTHSIIGKTLNIKRGSESAYGIENVKPTIEIYDIENSNLDELIEIMPDSLRFNLSALINPLGNISSGNDFLYFEKGIEATISLDIPLRFSANSLVIEDYGSMSFSDDEKLKSGRLMVYAENMYPFELNIQFYLLDGQNQIVDSLLNEKNLITSAIMDANGFAKTPSMNVLEIPLSPAKISLLRNTKELLIRARINSFENKVYQLYENNRLEINIVGDLKYEI